MLSLYGTLSVHVFLVESVLRLVEHADTGVQSAGLLRKAVFRTAQLLQLPKPLLPLLHKALHSPLALLSFLLLPGLQPGVVLPQPPAQVHPLRLQVLLFLPEELQALPFLVQLPPVFLHIPLLLPAGQHMEHMEDFLPPPLQALFLHPQHLQIALGIPLPLGNFMKFPGQLLVLQPLKLLGQSVQTLFDRPGLLLLPLLQYVKPADEIPYPGPLGGELSGRVPVAKGLLPHTLRLPAKGPNRITALNLGAVVPVLAGVLLHDALEFLHPVPVLVQLVLHSVQKPFLHQPLLVPAVGEQIRQAGFLQVDLFDDGLPFLIVDLVLRQLIEILPGLGRIAHVIIEKRDAALPLVGLKQLLTGGEAFQGHLFLRLLHHREMVDVLLAARLVFRYEIHDFQIILGMPLSHALIGNLLALSHHHAGEHVPGPLIQLPLHQDEGGLVGGKIAGEGAVLGVLVPPVHKGRHHHLHQHGFPTAVAQGQQGALPMELEGLVADADGIVVVIQVDQANRVNLAHISPPKTLRTRWNWFWFSRFQSMN